MKAMRIHAHGGPEAMAFEDIEIAPAPRGHVRVRHTAIALNFSDINVRRGGFYQKEPMAMPLIPGNEAAGVVASVGEDVTQWKPGDRVAYAGMHGPFYRDTGAYAQERNVPADRLVAIPDDVPDQVACGLLLKGATAASIIERIFPPRQGQTILVHAAASGVGSILTRWASHLGATVIGTVGSQAKADAARANGAAHAILYRERDFVAAVRRSRPRRRRGVRRRRQGHVCALVRLHRAIRHAGELRQRVGPCAAHRHDRPGAEGLALHLPSGGQLFSQHRERLCASPNACSLSCRGAC